MSQLSVSRRQLLVTAALCVSLFGAGFLAVRAQVVPDTLPAELGDREFWSLITESSEPDGFFRSDNLVSNERTFQEVIPELKKRALANGVYLGVGPDQNFTYIAALHPRMAFIVDIRREQPAAAPVLQGARRDVERPRRLPLAPVLAASGRTASTRCGPQATCLTRSATWRRVRSSSGRILPTCRTG